MSYQASDHKTSSPAHAFLLHCLPAPLKTLLCPVLHLPNAICNSDFSFCNGVCRNLYLVSRMPRSRLYTAPQESSHNTAERQHDPSDINFPCRLCLSYLPPQLNPTQLTKLSLLTTSYGEAVRTHLAARWRVSTRTESQDMILLLLPQGQHRPGRHTATSAPSPMGQVGWTSYAQPKTQQHGLAKKSPSAHEQNQTHLQDKRSETPCHKPTQQVSPPQEINEGLLTIGVAANFRYCW